MNPHELSLLDSTFGDVHDLKERLKVLGSFISSGDTSEKQISKWGESTQFTEQDETLLSIGDTCSNNQIETELLKIRQVLSIVKADYQVFSKQTESITSDIFAYIACTDTNYYKTVYELVKILRSELFSKLENLNTKPFQDCIMKFMDHYVDLKCSHEELDLKLDEISHERETKISSDKICSCKSKASLSWMDQTAVFELIEREATNSARELEQAKANFEARLNTLSTTWENEKSSLIADLHNKEASIEELRELLQTREVEANKKLRVVTTDYLELKAAMETLSRRFCPKEQPGSGALDKINSFLSKLEKLCPWIWDLFYGNRSTSIDRVIPDPTLLALEHKAALDQANLQRNAVEDKFYQIKQELNNLQESYSDLSKQLDTKNQEADTMSKQIKTLEDSVARYRSYLERLADPNVATAFASSLTKRFAAQARSSESSENTSTSSTVNTKSVGSSFSAQCSSSLMNTLPTMSLSSHNSSSTTPTLCATETVSSKPNSSILSRVGAAVTAFATAITSPKRSQPIPESHNEVKRSRIDSGSSSTSASVPLVQDCKSIPEGFHFARPNIISEDRPLKQLPTKVDHFIIPDTHKIPTEPKVLEKRRPLAELPPTIKTPGIFDVVAFPNADLGAKRTKNEANPCENLDKMFSDSDFTFLKNGPLAESTTQLPPNPFHVAGGLREQRDKKLITAPIQPGEPSRRFGGLRSPPNRSQALAGSSHGNSASLTRVTVEENPKFENHNSPVHSIQRRLQTNFSDQNKDPIFEAPYRKSVQEIPVTISTCKVPNTMNTATNRPTQPSTVGMSSTRPRKITNPSSQECKPS